MIRLRPQTIKIARFRPHQAAEGGPMAAEAERRGGGRKRGEGDIVVVMAKGWW